MKLLHVSLALPIYTHYKMNQLFKVQWNLLYDLQTSLDEITGMDEVTLQPAAGAHGEWTALNDDSCLP